MTNVPPPAGLWLGHQVEPSSHGSSMASSPCFALPLPLPRQSRAAARQSSEGR
ncbi:hypothetical protein LI328DRAFT_123777 [Trichoderma asperelloides]|nr:hypothetical protein LI328DRAFT_123777 [Trichoderma asperelloides]